MTEANLPAAKKDMLAFALKEKELHLLSLKEAAAAKKTEEDSKMKEEVKDVEQKESSQEKPKKEVMAPPRLSQLITTASQTIVTEFLKNKSFQDQIRETADGDEIQILTKFKALASEILDEACSSNFDCAKT